nr:Sim12 [Streptomyces antibioticus]
MTSDAMTDAIRVESGHLEPEELAALTVVLLARIRGAAPDRAAGDGGSLVAATWRRLERANGFQSPSSWRTAC